MPCDKCKDGECTGACLGMKCPIYVPPSLYDRAKAEGFDLRGYARQRPIPTTDKRGF